MSKNTDFSPFRIMGLVMSSVISIFSGFMSIPFFAKIILAISFGSLFLILLGYSLRNLVSPNFGIISMQLTRERAETRVFIEKAINHVKRTNSHIEIDCMGIQLSSVVDFLMSKTNDYNWNNAKFKFLLLKSGSEGVKQRIILENNRSLDLTTSLALESAKDIQSTFTKMNCDIKIKLFTFLPSFYIIRINDFMLVGYYFKGKGNTCPFMVLRSGKNTLFNCYKEYFDKIYSSNLSEETI